MTERPATPDDPGSRPELDPDVELASALHDGEAGEHERARAGDAGVVAARQVVAAVADRVGDVPAPPPGLVDDHVAAALAAFGEDAGDGSSAAAVPLAGRRRWYARAPLGAVAAAVAVVALVGALGLATAGDDDDSADRTATAALDADEAGDDAPAEAFDAESGVAAGAGGATALAGEREAYGSYDELASALAEQAAVAGGDATDTVAAAPMEESGPAAAGDATARDDAAGCDAVGATGLDPADVRLVSPVLVADRLVTAVVDGAGDDLRLTVVDDETCAVVEQRPLR